MASKLVYVELDEQAARALRALADRELREPRKQASILVREGLRRARPCARCKQEKPAAAFRSNPAMRDGLSSWCRPCFLARTQQWRRENRARINAVRRAQYRRNRQS